MSITYRQALKEGAAVLAASGIEEAELDSWYLLSLVTGMSRAKFFMEQTGTMPPEQEVHFREMITARGDRIPLQHLLGEAWFMGLPFEVNGDVLIPRQDTEKLVELVLEAQKRGDIPLGGQLLDMCTGSGCIAISLDVLGEWETVDAVDLSPAALEVASRNAERNRSKVLFTESDLFASLNGKRYDVIVSNPPYIPTAQCEELMPEVRDHDPRLALDGREDGLYFYRKLAEECPAHLNPGGRVFWEIGWDQGEAVRFLMQQAGFRAVEVLPDDTGKDRVVTGEWLCLTD